jgi:soluble lytic murein transglycosylase-like protein
MKMEILNKLGGISDITKLNSNLDLNTANFRRIEKTLESLKGINGKDGIKKAAQGFESMFIMRMLKEMRKTVPKNSLYGDSFAMDIYTSMFDEKLVDRISESQSFGLSDMLIRYLNKKYDQDENTEVKSFMDKSTEIESPLNEAKAFNGTVEQRVGRFDAIIAAAAEQFNVDPDLIKAVIAQESNGDFNAVSKSGAKGLMQLMDSTARELNVNNVFDPTQNIKAGVRYLKKMLDNNNGDVSLALASYNAGPGAVKLFDGIPPYPETRNYIHNVVRLQKQFQQQVKPKA